MITIERKISETEKEVWGFNAFDLHFVFVRYYIEHKPKRKWVILKKWDKYLERDSTISEPSAIPEEIKSKLIEEITSRIRILTWKEFKS